MCHTRISLPRLLLPSPLLFWRLKPYHTRGTNNPRTLLPPDGAHTHVTRVHGAPPPANAVLSCRLSLCPDRTPVVLWGFQGVAGREERARTFGAHHQPLRRALLSPRALGVRQAASEPCSANHRVVRVLVTRAAGGPRRDALAGCFPVVQLTVRHEGGTIRTQSRRRPSRYAPLACNRPGQPRLGESTGGSGRAGVVVTILTHAREDSARCLVRTTRTQRSCLPPAAPRRGAWQAAPGS